MNIQLQLQEYRKFKRGEYRLKRNLPSQPQGVPYMKNRIIVVTSDFAERFREYYSSTTEPTREELEKIRRKKRRKTEKRRLEWSLKK